MRIHFNRRTAVKAAAVVAGATALALGTAACGEKPADVVSDNLSNAADNFQIKREIDVINTVTGEHIMSIRGLCSLGNDDPDYRLSITCKTGEDEHGNGQYIKDFVYTPQTVTVLVQQLGSAHVSSAHYSVTWNPGVLVPNFNKAGGVTLTPTQPGTESQAQPNQEAPAQSGTTTSAAPRTKIVPVPGRTVTVQSDG